MAEKHKVKLGKDGALKFPKELCRLYGLREGKEVTIETSVEGIVVNPIYDERMEVFTDERIAEFLLNNAIGEDEYWIMRKEVVKLGLDPDTILHQKPDGTLVEERK